VAKVVTKFYRPLTVFDYDEKNTFQKCFSYSSPDSSTKKHDLKYYILENKTKINVNAPILIPTKYLTIIKFKHEINLANNKNVEN
jgi:hypothetical protein